MEISLRMLLETVKTHELKNGKIIKI